MKIRLKKQTWWYKLPTQERNRFRLAFGLCISSFILKEFFIWLLYGVRIFFNNEKMLWFRMFLSNSELWLLLLFFISLIFSIWYGGKLIIYSDNLQKKEIVPEKPTAQNAVFNGVFLSFFSLFFLTLVMIGSVVTDESLANQEPLNSGTKWLDYVANNGLELLILSCVSFAVLSIVVLIWNFQRKIKVKVDFKW